MLNNLLAQSGAITNPAVGNLGTTEGVGFLQRAIPAVIAGAYVIGVLIFFFVLITGAIGWMTSGGDKQKVETARGKLTSAIVGLVILFAVFAIIQVLQNFFHISILKVNIPSLVAQ